MNTSTTFFSLALGKAVSLRSKHSCLLTSTVSYIMTWSYLEPWHSSARSSSKPASVSAAGSGCSGGSSLFPIRDSEFSGKITKNYEFGVSSWFYFSAEMFVFGVLFGVIPFEMFTKGQTSSKKYSKWNWAAKRTFHHTISLPLLGQVLWLALKSRDLHQPITWLDFGVE